MLRHRSTLAPLHLACALLLGACGKTDGNGERRGAFSQAGTGGAGAISPASGTGGVSSLGGAGGSVAGVGGALPQAGSVAAGSGASGAGGSSAGSAGAGGVAAPGTSLDRGNYFQSGAWMGYVWTSTSGAGSTISPMSFEAQATGMPRCVAGSVSAQPDYSGTAILGFNLSEGPGLTSMTVTPSKAGVVVDVTNRASSPLRFQIKSAVDGGTEWCAPLTGSGGFIAWESLRTACWGTTGTPYAREPIASAMVLVPGTNSAAVQFDFCVNALGEGDGPIAGGSGGSGGAGGAGGGAGSAGAGQSGTGGETVPPVENGCDGFATRYWDCCKPHCGWSGNSPSGALSACDASDNSLGGNYDVGNACDGGSAFLCQHNTPWAVSDNLAYGFAAVSANASADICGKCYQLDFSGSSHNAGADPGSALLAGKHMIVQAINVGGDVGSGQFDLAIPGGGVGAFNACSTQWGVSTSQLGPDYGGFLAACKQSVSATDLSALKGCVMQKCTEVFGSRGLTELERGCRWFVDWFHAADNPSLRYAEVPCPSALSDRGIRRSSGGGGCL